MFHTTSLYHYHINTQRSSIHFQKPDLILQKSDFPDSWLSTISQSNKQHTSSYSGVHMRIYIRRQRIPQCSLPPKTALPRLRGGANSYGRRGNYVSMRSSYFANFERSQLEVRSKLARSSFELGRKSFEDVTKFV